MTAVIHLTHTNSQGNQVSARMTEELQLAGIELQLSGYIDQERELCKALRKCANKKIPASCANQRFSPRRV